MLLSLLLSESCAAAAHYVARCSCCCCCCCCCCCFSCHLEAVRVGVVVLRMVGLMVVLVHDMVVMVMILALAMPVVLPQGMAPASPAPNLRNGHRTSGSFPSCLAAPIVQALLPPLLPLLVRLLLLSRACVAPEF